MPLRVTTQEFWRTRIWEVVASGLELHQIIYRTDIRNWNNIQYDTAKLLRGILPTSCRLLDAGCGYGALYEVLHAVPHFANVQYTGLDLSEDLIGIAKIRYPNAIFKQCRLEDADYPADHFDYTVFRSVEGMLNDNGHSTSWTIAFDNVKRMSKNIILIEYGAVSKPTILTKNSNGEWNARS
jgi:SAM-dependent methyltransferase